MGYRFTASAESELDDIWLYVARESGSEDVADRVIDRITDALYLLSCYPYVGRRRDDLRIGLRTFPSSGYIVVYRIVEADVLILQVLHRSRDVSGFFDG